MENESSNTLKLPPIGVGTYDLKEEQILDAINVGYRLIDTASQYGNEEAVGKAVRRSGISRNDILVSTKLWNEDIRQRRTREAFFESLRRLDMDYVDLFLIHWPAEGYEQAWIEMEKLHNEGYIRAIGVSNFHKKHFEVLEGVLSIRPVVNQIESHPRFHNQDLIDYCKDRGMQIQAWSPFGGTGARMLQNDVLVRIAQKHQKSSSQIALRWHIQRGIIPLPRSANKYRLRLNTDIFDFELDCEDMLLIDSIDTKKRLGANPEAFDF